MTNESSPQTIRNRYILQEKLGVGGMGAVYRATDRLTGQVLALKRVLSPMEQVQDAGTDQTADFRLALSVEFRTLASLRHPHIVSVIDYGFDQEQKPYFTMGLVEKAQTLLQAAEDQPLTEQVRLVVDLLLALTYLHHRNILHRDIKPGNVLVDASGSVKMLDFGLSLSTSYSMTNMDTGIAGTLAYMAPELFTEEEASVASDLYAVGVVAYELFTGERPFDSKNVALMLNNILNTPPDLSDIDLSIEPVISRLLAKNPDDRYASATDTLAAFCAAVQIPNPQETSEIRESFLHAGRMVGRDQELNQLREILNKMMNGQGSFWLISGESGVGKSRLVDELRVRAMIKGVIVLRGQAVSEGGSTYHCWRNILRSLVLHSTLDDIHAGIIKALIPDLDQLLGRTIEETPPLSDPIQTQFRLFRVVRDLIESQTEPLLIIVENLQWAGEDSLALTNFVAGLLDENQLLLLGTYRNEETPDIPNILNGPPRINLNRLSRNSITELSTEMLGESGKSQHIVELLHRETEGNAYFLIEVVRALAEEAGQLTDIGSMTLPQRVFAGGIQSVLDRRLKQVPEDDRPLLQLAAIAGREIDLKILQMLAPQRNLEQWLTDCANAAVLDIVDETWQFAHTKLRDILLEEILDVSRPILYQRVAEALEEAYPDDSTQVATLAHLWQVAENPEKELEYSKKAGLQAASANSDQEAIRYLRKALELTRLQPENKERLKQELEIQMPLNIALVHTQGFTSEEVENSWMRSQELCTILDNPPETLGVLWGLCGMYMIRGDNDTAADMDTEIIKFADSTPFPELTKMQALYTRTLNLIALGEIDLALQEANSCLALYRPEYAEPAIEMYGSTPGITTKALIASLLHIQGYPEQARALYDEAIAEARELEHKFTLATSLTYCWIAQLRGDVENAYELSSENVQLSGDYGFLFYQLLTTPVLGWAMAQRGEVDQGIQMMRQSMAMLNGMGANLMRNYFLGMLAEALIHLEQIEDAKQVIEEALSRIESSVDRFYEPEIYRLKGDLLWTHEGNEEEAEEYLQKALEVARERNVKWFELRAASCLASLWKKQGKQSKAHELLQEICAWFTEGFDTPDLKNAKALLTELT